jgi:uncharacterized C2H2 Zn-finger protein
MKGKLTEGRVDDRRFDYEEEVRDFTGLIFHCPNCDEVFHLHIATIKLVNKVIK